VCCAYFCKNDDDEKDDEDVKMSCVYNLPPPPTITNLYSRTKEEALDIFVVIIKKSSREYKKKTKEGKKETKKEKVYLPLTFELKWNFKYPLCLACLYPPKQQKKKKRLKVYVRFS
jgi:hypothetical protein